jgi:hypothetical protein
MPFAVFSANIRNLWRFEMEIVTLRSISLSVKRTFHENYSGIRFAAPRGTSP